VSFEFFGFLFWGDLGGGFIFWREVRDTYSPIYLPCGLGPCFVLLLLLLLLDLFILRG